MRSQIDAREQLLSGMPLIERRVQLAGIPTVLQEGGDGPPMVLLHGPGGAALDWMQVIPELVKSHMVVAPDLPGQGASGSGPGPAPLTVDRVLGWLGELIDHTCPSPPVLVGYAWGAAIGARFAADQSRRLSHLVLVDALGLTRFDPAPAFARALNDFIAQPTGDTHERLWRQCTHDFDQVQQQMGAQWEMFEGYRLDLASRPGVHEALGTLMELFAFPAIPDADLARITAPTAMIWGRHDIATPLEVAQRASVRYGWPLQVIEESGGEPAIEEPDRFVRALHAVLGRVGSA
jgi:pimeloyl-ACP methyl ester carboxylesterase